MKSLVYIFLFCLVLTSCSEGVSFDENRVDEIGWLTIEEAEAFAKKKPKKILIDVYTEWCGPCKMMDRMTFADPEVIKYVNKNFYPVKFNAESGDPIKFKGNEYANLRFDPNRSPRSRNSQHQLAQFFKVSGYPTVVFLDEKLEILDAARGLHPKDKFLGVMTSLN